MWARARICISPVKGNCTPQKHNFIRHLRTQCTNFHPRGHARRDLVETSHCGKIGDDGAPGISRTSQTHQKDRRSIDSMDPVVLKYTNMVNELRSQSSGVERVNETHFGSIRFDNENIPRLHGLFDKEYGPVATPSKRTAPKFHLKLHDGSGQNEVLKISEQEQLQDSSHESSVNLQESQNRLNETEEELKVNEHIRNCHTGSSNDESENKVIVNDSSAVKDNYIDESAFGDSLSSTSRNLRPPGLQSTIFTDSEINVKVNNLNYIDEVFFKNTIENLEINRQPAIDFSEIKKDLEDSVLFGEKHLTIDGNEGRDGEILGHVTKNIIEQKSKDRGKVKEHLNTNESNESPKSAYEYVLSVRREERKKQHGLAQEPGDGSNKSYKKILSLVSEKTKTKYTRYEVLKSLKSSILYNDRKYMHN